MGNNSRIIVSGARGIGDWLKTKERFLLRAFLRSVNLTHWAKVQHRASLFAIDLLAGIF
jgi:hypothetical protein